MLTGSDTNITMDDPFADFDNLDVKELRLRPSAEEKKLRVNDEKASFISIILLLTV